jgi:hypothetical protein
MRPTPSNARNAAARIVSVREASDVRAGRDISGPASGAAGARSARHWAPRPRRPG